MRFRMCGMAFEIRCVHSCGETHVHVFVRAVARVELFVSAVSLPVCELTVLDNTTTSIYLRDEPKQLSAGESQLNNKQHVLDPRGISHDVQ